MNFPISQVKIFHKKPPFHEIFTKKGKTPRIFELFQDLAGIQTAIPWLQMAPNPHPTTGWTQARFLTRRASKQPQALRKSQTWWNTESKCWGNGDVAKKNRTGESRGSSWIILLPIVGHGVPIFIPPQAYVKWWSTSWTREAKYYNQNPEVAAAETKNCIPTFAPWEYVTVCPWYWYQVVVALLV